jgi:hypothetical protein
VQYRTSVITRVMAAFTVACLAFAENAAAEPLRVWVILSAPMLTMYQHRTLREEVNRIWEPYDVDLQWHDKSPEFGEWPGFVVTVRVDDSKIVSRRSPDFPVLGEVRVVGNRMLPTITISPEGVKQIVARGISPADNFPRFSYVYARFIGRVIAHEFGHLFLRSRDHVKRGLMRARFTFRDATADYRQGFHLEPEIVARLADPARTRGAMVDDMMSGSR